MRPVALSLLLSALLLCGAAHAQGHALRTALKLGDSPAAAQAALSAAGAESIQILPRDQPQSLSQGLIQEKLLETLNRFALAPVRSKAGLDQDAFAAILLAGQGERRIVLSFETAGAGGKSLRLRYALVRVPVPVDPAVDPAGGWSPDRLHRLREALAEWTAFQFQVLERDRYGNAFAWKGRQPNGGEVRLWYLPEDDELRVLLSP